MKVLLIDDHPLILAALKIAISGLEEGVSVVDVANAQAAREVEDPDVAVYSAATSHLETERSILLSKMLTTLLEKHEDSRSQVFRAAALPLAGYDGYEQRQEYSFQSTAKAGKKRGGGGW